MIVTIQNIIPGVAYKVQFAGVDSAGTQTEWTNTYDLFPPGTSPNDAPTGGAFAYTTGNINVSWAAPVAGLKPDFSHYLVEVYTPADGLLGTYNVDRDTNFNFTLALNDSLFPTPIHNPRFRVYTVTTANEKSTSLTLNANYTSMSGTFVAPVAEPVASGINWKWVAPATNGEIVAYYEVDVDAGAVEPTFNEIEAKVYGLNYLYIGSASTQYSVKLRAVDVFGRTFNVTGFTTANSLAAGGTTDSTPPSGVLTAQISTTVTPQPLSKFGIAVDWSGHTPSEPILHYIVEWGTASATYTNSATIATQNYIISNLPRAASGSIFVRIRPVDKAGNVATTSTEKSVGNLALPTTLPTAFTGVWTTPTLRLTWSAPAVGVGLATDVVGYNVTLTGTGGSKVFYTTSTYFNFTPEVNYGSGVGGSSAYAKTLSAVSIKAVYDNGTESAAVAGGVMTNTFAGTPATPTVIVGTKTMHVAWSTFDGAVEYVLYAGTTASPGTEAWRGFAIDATIPVSGVLTWYTRIVAINILGTSSSTSADSTGVAAQVADVTAPDVPNQPALTTSSDSTDPTGSTSVINATWTSKTTDPDLAGHMLRYSTSNSTGWDYIRVSLQGAAGSGPGGVGTGPGAPGVATSQTVTIKGLRAGSSQYVQIAAIDQANNFSAWVTALVSAPSAYPMPVAADTVPISVTPATPSVSVSTQRIQVTHNGLTSTATAMPSDVVSYEVYASTTSGFTPGTSTLLGTINAGPAIGGIWSVPASKASPTGVSPTQTWYVKVIAVDFSNNKSPASAQNTGNVPLIDAVNIGDATITTAKITTLDANQITAATTFTTDLYVGNAGGGGMTVNGAGGYIRSNDYVSSGGTAGWKLSQTGLDIITGTIRAKALDVANAVNLLPAKLMDTYFNTTYWTKSAAAHPTDPSIGAVTERCTLVVSAGQYIGSGWFGISATDYNVPVQPSTQYTASFYARASTAASGVVGIGVVGSSGTVLVDRTTYTSVNSAWVRVTGTFTTGATDTAVILGAAGGSFGVDLAPTVYLSGIQVNKGAAATTYAFPGANTFDGYGAITQAIRSSKTITVNGVSTPAWVVNDSGVAEFANLRVRGSAVIGSTKSDGTDADGGLSYLQSANFVTGVAGWRIASSGNAELNSATLRGSLTNGNANVNIFVGTTTWTDYSSTTYSNPGVYLNWSNPPTWSSATAYVYDDQPYVYVKYGSPTVYYKCLLDGTNKQPDLFPTYWQPVLDTSVQVGSIAWDDQSNEVRVVAANAYGYEAARLAVTASGYVNSYAPFGSRVDVYEDSAYALLRANSDTTYGGFAGIQYHGTNSWAGLQHSYHNVYQGSSSGTPDWEYYWIRAYRYGIRSSNRYYSDTDFTTRTITDSTSWTANTVCGVAFEAPSSGRVRIDFAASINGGTAGRIYAVGVDVNTGSTLGGGSDVLDPTEQRSVRMQGTDLMQGSNFIILGGLTAGAQYNARLVQLASATGGTWDVNCRSLSVTQMTESG